MQTIHNIQHNVKHIALVALLALGIISLATVSARASVETYKIDTAHSGITFKIRHFVAKTPGKFKNFSGEVKLDRQNMENSSVNANISVTSIDTANEKRDKHLNADDYFNTEKWGNATFESKQWTQTGENTYDVLGHLTLMSQTHPVTLNTEILGFAEGFNGQALVGITATTTIDRTQWGLTAGAPAVGNEVELEINIEGHLQQ